MNNNKYLVAGGPGLGKSTLVGHLGLLHFATKPEAARKVIDWNLKHGGNILPWINRDLFDDHLLSIMKFDYETVDTSEVTIFDGTALDIIAWRNYLNLNCDRFRSIVDEFIFSDPIFIPEPWPELYFQDEIRPFSYDEAQKVTDMMVHFYTRLGHSVCIVPKGTPIQRALFVSSEIRKSHA